MTVSICEAVKPPYSNDNLRRKPGRSKLWVHLPWGEPESRDRVYPEMICLRVNVVCETCGTLFDYEVGGRTTRKHCSAACRPSREDAKLRGGLLKNEKTRVCTTCMKPFITNKKSGKCSNECTKSAQDNQHKKRTSEAMARRARICQQCGESFIAGVMSGAQKRGEVRHGIYCSRKCVAQTPRSNHLTPEEICRRKIAAKEKRLALRESESRPCVVCRTIYAPFSKQSKYCGSECAMVAAKKRQCYPAKEAVCLECEEVFTARGGTNRRKYCSNKCCNKRVRRIRRARCSAEERGGTAGNIDFDPVDILRRDGWKCYLCGCDTPSKLRGTIEPTAPELDHIIPVSKGGLHHPSNTACACRKCNILKSDNDNYAPISTEMELFA